MVAVQSSLPMVPSPFGTGSKTWRRGLPASPATGMAGKCANHPAWLTFEDVQHLMRLHLRHGFGRPVWMGLVATGKIPGYNSSLSDQIRYKWDEVVASVEGSMKRVGK